MQMLIGRVLKVSILHATLHNGVFRYQRRIPRDLAARYPTPHIKISLGTADPLLAAKKVEDLDEAYEREWRLLRDDPSRSPEAAAAHAIKLLEENGINPEMPKQDRVALELFAEKLDDRRYALEWDEQRRYREADPEEYLNPVERAALEIIHKGDKVTLSTALAFYLQHKGKSSASWRKSSTIALEAFIRAAGDKELQKMEREDGRRFIAAMLERGIKTTTIRRYLKSVIAVFNFYTKEAPLKIENPLEKMGIADEGEDAESRSPLLPESLKLVQQRCREIDDDPRWLLAMLSDTGARVAECCGLALADIKLDGATPHIMVEHRPWRRVDKGAAERHIPLVGEALWAAQRVIATAEPGQVHAFPRYVTDGKCRAASASATLNNWMRSIGAEHTCHELRHTMRDRLRDVECPREIAHGIGGWAGGVGLKTSKGDGYGLGYRLHNKHQWLERAIAGPLL